MNFSAFNRLTQVSSLMSAGPGDRVGPKVKAGGAFSPNTVETLYAMRTHFDNQWEKGFVLKFRTTMQNRLNQLAKDLRDAYSALLNISTTQLVGHGLDVSSNREDVAALKYMQLAGAADPFADWGAGSDTEDGSMPDAMASYRRNFAGRSVEMRRLGAIGAAMDQHNSIGITMRTQEAPLDSFFGADVLGAIGQFMSGGDPPFKGKQKVAEYKSELATGGYWSTINYLYAFNPRQLKYTYATSYSVNSEEAGTRHNSNEGYLFNARLVDQQDMPGDQYEQGKRVKWQSTDSNEGYLTEVDPDDQDWKVFFREDADMDGDGTFERAKGSEVHLATTDPMFGKQLIKDRYGKDVLIEAPEQSQYGEGQEINHLYINHFNVTLRDAEFNSVGSEGTITSTVRTDVSDGLDGNMNLLVTPVMAEDAAEDLDGDGFKDDPNEPDGIAKTVTKLPGSGKITRNFTQKLWNDFFSIESFNNQQVLGNSANPYIGELDLIAYEGVERARAMSQGFMTTASVGSPSVMEINATTVVPTDWYFAEDKGGGAIWFPFVKGTNYAEPAVPNDTHYQQQTVQFRKVLNLTEDEWNAIPEATGLVLQLEADDQAYFMLNGEVMNLGGLPTVPGVPLTVTIPKSKLKIGENMIGAQVDEYGGGEAFKVTLPAVLNPLLSGSVRSALNSRITTDGSGSDMSERANFWQARIIPRQGGGNSYLTRSPLDPPIYETNSFKMETTGTEAPTTNPLSIIIMEAMNNPLYRDVFRLGLVKNLTIKGIANTPNGSTLTGSILLDYDTSQRKLKAKQVKLTARQGS